MSRSTLQERSWRWFAAAAMRAARTPEELEAATLEHTHARLRRASGGRTVIIISTPQPQRDRLTFWARRFLGTVVALLLISCASLTHEPGTPYGGVYCTQRGGDPEAACYPSEAERAAAWRQREAEGRRAWAAEHPEEARAIAAERARIASDFEAQQRAQAQAETDQAAARVQEADNRAAARAADQQAREAAAARLELARQRATDPTYAGPALSALLCQQQAREAEFRADLKRETRISAISGVIDKRTRSSLAAGVVDAQDRSDRLRERLRAVGAKPLPCAAVTPLLVCRAGNELACREPGARDQTDVLRQLESQ